MRGRIVYNLLIGPGCGQFLEIYQVRKCHGMLREETLKILPPHNILLPEFLLQDCLDVK